MKPDNGYGLQNTLIHRDNEKYFESYDGLEKVTRLTDKKPSRKNYVLKSLKNNYYCGYN